MADSNKPRWYRYDSNQASAVLSCTTYVYDANGDFLGLRSDIEAAETQNAPAPDNDVTPDLLIDPDQPEARREETDTDPPDSPTRGDGS